MGKTQPQPPRPFFPCEKSRRGSALILSLLMAGLVAFSVGSMLLSVRYLTHGVRDKMAMEESYQAAMSGLHLGRAWLADPAQANTMLSANGFSSDIANDLQNLRQCAADMSKDVIEHSSSDPNYGRKSPSQIVDAYFSGENDFTAEGTQLSDGRIVLYTLPVLDNGRIASFDSNKETNVALTSTGATEGSESFVSRIRITTPYPPNTSGTYPSEAPWNGQPWIGESEGLRRTSLIMEALGVATSGNRQLSRVVQQKLLVFPQIDPAPAEDEGAEGVRFGHAIVAGANVSIDGTSSLKIHWGAVMAKGNIEVLTLEPLSVRRGVGTLNAGNKFFGAGVNQEGLTDYWVKYQATGQIYKKQGGNITALFPSTGINGVQVQDFFAQFKAGVFGTELTSVDLDGDYVANSIDSIVDPNYRDPETGELAASPNMLYAMDETGNYVHGAGALVQNTPAVGDAVDYVLDQTMNYTYWKQRAIDENGYIRPSTTGTGFVNHLGNKLYVAPDGTLTTSPSGGEALTALGQLTMKSYVPAGGETEYIADRVLFIDTPEGAQGGTHKNYTLNASDNFFWKGLFYVNGNLSTSGGGAFPTVKGRDPNQYAAWALQGLDVGSTSIADCFIRGTVAVTGTYSRTGNAAVYGTMVAKGGYAGSGSPDIWYDMRNKMFGLFTPPPDPSPDDATPPPSTYQICGGPLTEMGAWPE